MQPIDPPQMSDGEYVQWLEAEVKRLSGALEWRKTPGGCKMLSEGFKCDCTLCRQSREIERLQEKLKVKTQKLADQETQKLAELDRWSIMVREACERVDASFLGSNGE